VKINEVERLAGITKGNIRFYEKEGLLTPGRNSENGYRDYSQADVDWLKKIRLLRMLDVPIEEILRLRAGVLTLEDAMGRHIIQLEREQSNLAAMQAMCGQLRERHSRLDTLDVDAVLAEMEQKEQEGTRFMDVKQKDRRTKYVGPVMAAAIMLVLMGWAIGVLVWAFAVDPQNAPPLWVAILLVAVPAAVMVGVLLALYQRVKQIKGGEEDAAAQY
jgi:DNA-binding transcriptional MerR regulator